MSTQLSDRLDSHSIYLPTQAKVVDIRPLTRLERLFKMELPDGISLGHKPGQFVMVSILGVGEAPISVSSSPSRSNGTFEICIRNAGALTGAIHQMSPGEKLGVRGPFGNGLPLERFRGKDLLFAPGGLGLAPLRSSINQVIDERENFGRIIILYGARNPSELLFLDEMEEWRDRQDVELYVTVDRPDENWHGNVGVVTTLFPKVRIDPLNTIGVTVGPPVMYRFVLIEMLGMRIREGNIWLSLERRMRCGVGKCGHCQVNHIYTCQDGPVFSYAQIKHLKEAL